MLLDRIPRVSKSHARLNELYSLVEALACSLNNSDRLWIRKGFRANIVRLVEVTMEASMVDCDIEVENIAVK